MRAFFNHVKQNRRALGAASAGVSTFVIAANTDRTYPPLALSPGVKSTQPDWIKAGCGNSEYFWPAKGAVFPGDNTPEVMPGILNSLNMIFSLYYVSKILNR